MKEQIKHHSITVVVVLAVLAVSAGAFVYSGIYNIGADAPHSKPVFAIMQMVRDRSIHLHAKDITVPNLEDLQLILKGAGQYAAMCTGCHLAPGMKTSEIRPGLYPQPPNLSQMHVDPKDAFWVIKHGIKMSAMPAWGFSHDDPTIWSMVAFLQKLPAMTPEQYKEIVAKAPPDDDMDMGDGGHSHSHGGPADEETHGAADMKGMEMPGDGSHNHGAAASDSHAHAAVAPTSGNSANAMAVVEVPLSLAGLKPKGVPQAEAAARAFQAALQHGDRAAVLALLAPDVSISEGGHVQTRDEYTAGHLGQDIALLRAARVTLESMRSGMRGEQAVAESVSDIKATSNGTAESLRTLETLTLRRQDTNWLISTVHWRSDPTSQAAGRQDTK